MDSTDQYWSNLYTSGRDYTLIGTGEIDKLIPTVGVGERQKHLDIGCGTGQLTREFYHRGYTVVGIDPSAAAIEKAKNATAREGLTYYHGTIDQNTTLLENEGLFDVITCKLVYAFIEDKVTFLQNVNSILSRSGYFILITPHLDQVPSEKAAIAVDPELTETQLRRQFEIVDIYPIAGPLGNCYICKKIQ